MNNSERRGLVQNIYDNADFFEGNSRMRRFP
jgi:hypothetical protein